MWLQISTKTLASENFKQYKSSLFLSFHPVFEKVVCLARYIKVKKENTLIIKREITEIIVAGNTRKSICKKKKKIGRRDTCFYVNSRYK